MIACMYVYMSEHFKNQFSKEAEYNIKRIRNHPSLALISGNNEMKMFVTYSKNKLHYNDYLELYEHIFTDISERLAPVLLSIHEKGSNIILNISNEQLKGFEGKIKYAVKDVDFNVLLEDEVKVSVKDMSSKDFLNEDFGELIKDKEERTYFVATLFDGEDNFISQSTALFTKPKYFNFKKPEIEAQIKGEKGKFTLKIKSSNFQKFVGLDFTEIEVFFPTTILIWQRKTKQSPLKQRMYRSPQRGLQNSLQL